MNRSFSLKTKFAYFVICFLFVALGLLFELLGIRLGVVGRGDISDVFIVLFFVWGGWIFFFPALTYFASPVGAGWLCMMYFFCLMSMGIGDTIISYETLTFRRAFIGCAHYAVVFALSGSCAWILSLLGRFLWNLINRRKHDGS